jgi:hypothetical protein
MPSSQARKAARAAASAGGGSAGTAAAASTAAAAPQKRHRQEPPPPSQAQPAAEEKAKPAKRSKKEAKVKVEDEAEEMEDEPPAQGIISNAWEDDGDEQDVKEENGAVSGSSSSAAFGGKKMTERISCTLFVGQLPYTASAGDIKKHFKQGGVKGQIGVRLLTHREDGSSRGMAFVELGTEGDVHTALRLHKSPFEGRRINVERTVGGGGASEERKGKLKDLREKQGTQMRRQVRDMVASILPAGDAAALAEEAVATAMGDDGSGGAIASAVCQADLDERIMDFLGTVPTAIAEAALREAKALDMDGIRNRPAYLMGVLKRKVEDADRAKQAKDKERRQRQGGGGRGDGGGGKGGGGKGGGGGGGRGGGGGGGGGGGSGGGGGGGGGGGSHRAGGAQFAGTKKRFT